MSNEKQKPIERESPPVPRGIPVRLLRFVSNAFQVPGHGSTQTVSAVTQPNKTSWAIEYIPQIRHHKITYTDPNRNEPPKVAFVHESLVQCWEPLEL